MLCNTVIERLGVRCVSGNVGQILFIHFTAGDAKLEYLSLAFSMEGDKLVSLSGVPDFLLTIW